MRLPTQGVFFSVVTLSLLAACSSVPRVDESSTFNLPAVQVAVSLPTVVDRRTAEQTKAAEGEDWVKLPDSRFRATPGETASRLLIAELSQLPNFPQLLSWIDGGAIELHGFDATLKKLPGRPRPRSGNEHSAMAVVHPLAPLIGMGLTALTDQAQTESVARVEIRVVIHGKEYTGFGAGSLSTPPFDDVFVGPTRRAAQNLAQRLSAAAEYVELLEPPSKPK
jgi:hypothetical protein